MTIDVHAHCIPAAVLRSLERDGSRFGIEIVEADGRRRALIAGRVTTQPLRDTLFGIDDRLAAMDRAGVDIQLISSWIDLTAYALDPSAGAHYARMFNEGLSAVAAQQTDRFMPLCTVPLQAPEEAAAELRHAVSNLKMVGVEIATTVDGAELDDPRLDPFWAAAAALQCLVLVHPYDPLQGRGVSRYFLDNAIGRPAETSIAVGHMVLGGVFERFPDLRVCVVHGGGFLPYQAGRLDRAYHAKPEVAGRHLSRPPSEWLKNLYYDTVTHSPEVLRFLISFAGVERILLGTDYPFEMGDDDPVGTVKAIPDLSDEGRQLILTGNAARLLAEVRR